MNTVKQLRTLLAAVLALGGLAGPVRAQTPAARLLPLGHWAWDDLAYLAARGLLPALDPLALPWARSAIAQALGDLDPDHLPPHIARRAARLQTEFATPASGGAVFGGDLLAGVRAASGDRLDPARTAGAGAVWPRYAAGGWATAGPVALVARLAGDTWWSDDPDGADPGQRRGGRSDDAYVSVALPIGEIVLGRLRRHWGDTDGPALLLSDAATPYPQVAARLAVGRFTLHTVLGELDTLRGAKRYVAAHRLAYRTDRIVIALGESILYAAPAAGLSLRYLNPVEALFFDHANAPDDLATNLLLGAQVRIRLGPWTVGADLLLDDYDLRGAGPAGERSPPRYAAAATVALAPAASPADLTLRYEQVSAFAYRTETGEDAYTYLGRGLGTAYVDYDRVTVRVRWVTPVDDLELGPTVTLLRAGEGDLRAPALTFGPGAPTLFLGQRETTLRAAIAGRLQVGRLLTVTWDVGPNRRWHAGHVTGDHRLTLDGAAAATLTLPLPR